MVGGGVKSFLCQTQLILGKVDVELRCGQVGVVTITLEYQGPTGLVILYSVSSLLLKECSGR